MAEILNPEQVLLQLRDFGPLRRILLATPGTLQGTLSAYFGAPVTVAVRDQGDASDHKHFVREVDLVCTERGITACRARSEVDVEDEEIRTLIRERRIGLGQIIEYLRVPTTFELDRAGTSDACFWREYTLEGAGFRYRIREEFPADLYPAD
ncbi:MAG: hypothetical protein ACQGVC_19715 [Myxococcota bacterium]